MTVSHWINGAPVASEGASQPILDPSTGQQIGEVALADAAVVDAAVTSAVAAQRAWGDASLAKRMEVMYAFRQLLVDNTKELARTAAACTGTRCRMRRARSHGAGSRSSSRAGSARTSRATT